MLEAIERYGADVVLTTGDTGVSPTDVTPEAMDLVFEKEVPGMAEAMRAASLDNYAQSGYLKRQGRDKWTKFDSKPARQPKRQLLKISVF